MASPTDSRNTSTAHLDGYLKGIRDEFDRLNRELDETRKQRDGFETRYRNQAKELLELRQTISRCGERQGGIAHTCGGTDDNTYPLISPVSSSSEYHSSFEEEDASSDRLDNIGDSDDIGRLSEGEKNQEDGDVQEGDESNVIFTNKPVYSAWDVEINRDTKATLKLNLVHTLADEENAHVAFSADGKYLATASGSGIITIFDSKTGKKISVMKDLYEKSLPWYECVAFSPDSKYLATGELNGTVRIWIISKNGIRNIFRHHRRRVTDLNFSPNGQSIATCSYDDTVRIWRLRDGSSRVLRTELHPWSVRFSTDGRYLAAGCNPSHILIRNTRTGKIVAKWLGHPSVIPTLVFIPDGNGLLSGSWDKKIMHWDVSWLRSHELEMADPPRSSVEEISCLVGHTDVIQTISISPDGKWIASGSSDSTVRIWNAHDAVLHCILHCPQAVFSVDFSPIGNHLAIGGSEVTIWNYANL